MCFRFSQFTDPVEWARLFRIARSIPKALARYNASPGQDLLVVRQQPEIGGRTLDLLRWGLIPHWAKSDGIARKLINVQGEILGRTPSLQGAYRTRRCLVPVDDFFAWSGKRGVKQPYAVAMFDHQPFALGGLWDRWTDPKTGEQLHTFAIVTTTPNELIAPIHQRMPVIIAPKHYELWLESRSDPHDLIRPYPAGGMDAWQVSVRVNNLKRDDRSVIEPLF
jgi:putative SOS response-associated peptidase YedK